MDSYILACAVFRMKTAPKPESSFWRRCMLKYINPFLLPFFNLIWIYHEHKVTPFCYHINNAKKRCRSTTNTKKTFGDYVFENFSLCYVSLTILFAFLSEVFLLKLGMDLQKRINFNFIKSISKLCSVWYLFKIKWPKSELNICIGSVWTYTPPPHWKVCVWGGPYRHPCWFKWCQHKLWKLLKHFKLSITFLTGFILN